MSSNDSYEPSFGQLVFERSAVSRGISLAVIMVMVILLLAIPVIGAIIGQNQVNLVTFLVPLATIGFVFWLGRTLKRRRKQTLSCFQQGLVLEQNRNSTALRFDQLDSFTAGNMTVSASGLVQGVDTAIKFRWVPSPVDPQMAVLIELAGQSISEKLGTQLVEQGWVDWTPRTKLYTDKIVHRGMFAGEEEIAIETITFTSIVTGDHNQQELWIYSEVPDKPTLKIPTRLENFYPGYCLFGLFLAQRSEMTGEQVQVVSAAESMLVQSTGAAEESKTGWSSIAGIVWIIATIVTGIARCDRKKEPRRERQPPPPVHQPFNQQHIDKFIDEFRKKNEAAPDGALLRPPPAEGLNPAADPELKKVPRLPLDDLLPPPKL